MTTTAHMTENDLIDGCLQGNASIQKAVYEKYNKAMFTLAYRVLGDFEQAEDVLQEGFVKVFRSIGTFRRESTLGAWIKTIVVRTAYNKLRQKKVYFDQIDDGITQIGTLDWGHKALEAEYLEKAILSLPEGYRTVFLLIEVEGYAHREVAELLGISEGTSKSQLFYAKKKLRDLLSAYGY